MVIVDVTECMSIVNSVGIVILTVRKVVILSLVRERHLLASKAYCLLVTKWTRPFAWSEELPLKCAAQLAQTLVEICRQHWSHGDPGPPSIERGHRPCETQPPDHGLHQMPSGGGDPQSPFPSPHCVYPRFSAVRRTDPQQNVPSLGNTLKRLFDFAINPKPAATRARRGRGLDNVASKLRDEDIASVRWWRTDVQQGSHLGELEGVQSGICMWLTFCCLHSLHAFRLPPRRLPVAGGVFSISPGSGLLCVKSTSESGRDNLGDRKSLGEIKGGPFGASGCRYSKSIETGLCSPDIKPHGTGTGAPEYSSAGNRRNHRRWKEANPKWFSWWSSPGRSVVGDSMRPVARPGNEARHLRITQPGSLRRKRHVL